MPQFPLNPSDLFCVLALLSELLLEGLNREEIPGTGIRLLLILEDMVPEILCMVIRVRGPSEVLDGISVRLKVFKLIGVPKLPAVAVKFVTAFLSGSLFFGCIDPSLFSATFKFLSTGQRLVVIWYDYYRSRRGGLIPFLTLVPFPTLVLFLVTWRLERGGHRNG